MLCCGRLLFMFSDRTDAGTKLANELRLGTYTVQLVIGLARGGAVIARAISDALGIPTDILVVKKIGSPVNTELAIGALAPDGVSYLNDRLARQTGADTAYITSQISRLTGEIKQKTRFYRSGMPPVDIHGKTVILTDDGIATGATMIAAIRWAQYKRAKTILVAVPVAPPDVVTALRALVRTVVVLETKTDFGAVGEFYTRFPQLTDADVVKLLT